MISIKRKNNRILKQINQQDLHKTDKTTGFAEKDLNKTDETTGFMQNR